MGFRNFTNIFELDSITLQDSSIWNGNQLDLNSSSFKTWQNRKRKALIGLPLFKSRVIWLLLTL